MRKRVPKPNPNKPQPNFYKLLKEAEEELERAPELPLSKNPRPRKLP